MTLETIDPEVTELAKLLEAFFDEEPEACTDAEVVTDTNTLEEAPESSDLLCEV